MNWRRRRHRSRVRRYARFRGRIVVAVILAAAVVGILYALAP
jgi:hypothetical protein